MLDEKHGFVWCFGASLARLLPVIEINKEFTEFFNDPKRECLTSWALCSARSWFAAVSGLTQSS